MEKLGLQGDVRLLAQMSEKFLTHLEGIWESGNEHLKEDELEVLETELDKAFLNQGRANDLIKKFRKISEARK